VGAVSVYFDVNVVVALFAVDPLNERAERAAAAIRDRASISEFAATEFSSVIATRVRTRDLGAHDARNAYTNFDNWCALHAERVEVRNADVVAATTLVRRLDLSLRAPDALHLGIVRRIGARLLTFDKTMAVAARSLGIAVLNA
jgi:predicted nucleic acid-binding protein